MKTKSYIAMAILISIFSTRSYGYEPPNTLGTWDAIVKFDSAISFGPVPNNTWATAIFSGSYMARSGSWFNKCNADLSVSFIKQPYGLIFPTPPIQLRVRIDYMTITSGGCTAPTFSDPFLVTNIDSSGIMTSYLSGSLSPGDKRNIITAVLPSTRIYQSGGINTKDFQKLHFSYFNNREPLPPLSFAVHPSTLYIHKMEGNDYFFFRGAVSAMPDIDIY